MTIALFLTSELAEILTPIFGFAGIVVTSIVTLLIKHWLDKKADSTTAVFDGDLTFTLLEINEFHQRAIDLQAETPVERILILKAENGASHPRFATVIYEQYKLRAAYLAHLLYNHIVIDDQYRQMLKDVEQRGRIEMETATMPDSKLKGFYEAEKVTFSNCYFLTRYAVDDEKDILLYMTLATKQSGGFTKADHLQLDTFADVVKIKMETKTNTQIHSSKGDRRI